MSAETQSPWFWQAERENVQSADLRRAKPSVAFGGKYKIIDFVLSNLFNSGIKKVYILTQYRAYSLNKHIRESWGKWTGLGEFYVAISPETSSESEEWFKGTADAILQYLRFVESTDADYVAILAATISTKWTSPR
jgi:glucose-1-phosphate adenylyltransferase